MRYIVREWSPECPGDIVGEYTCISAAEAAARDCYQAQIESPAWGAGYVTTWRSGGASAQYFRGGVVPEDAAALAAALADFEAEAE